MAERIEQSYARGGVERGFVTFPGNATSYDTAPSGVLPSADFVNCGPVL